MTLSKPTNTSSTGIRNSLFYFLIGGGLGAAAALLLAPKSGTELRSEMSEAARKGYNETRELAHRLKERSDGLLQTITGKAEEMYEFASSKFSLTRDAIGDTFETAKYPIDADVRNESRNISKKYLGRRPSSVL
jgi:gas vesicle protein